MMCNSTSRQLEDCLSWTTTTAGIPWLVTSWGKGLHFHFGPLRNSSLVPGATAEIQQRQHCQWCTCLATGTFLKVALFTKEFQVFYRSLYCLWPLPGNTCINVCVSHYFSPCARTSVIYCVTLGKAVVHRFRTSFLSYIGSSGLIYNLVFSCVKINHVAIIHGSKHHSGLCCLSDHVWLFNPFPFHILFAGNSFPKNWFSASLPTLGTIQELGV